MSNERDSTACLRLLLEFLTLKSAENGNNKYRHYSDACFFCALDSKVAGTVLKYNGGMMALVAGDWKWC